MMSPFLTSLAAGFVSALLFMSGITGSGLGVVLMSLSPLPLFIAGLCFGMRGALIAVGLGNIVALLGMSGNGPLFYFGFAALPTLVLCYLALLVRASPGSPERARGETEWFPAGYLVLASALMSSLAVIAVLGALFGGSGHYAQTIEHALAPLWDALGKPLAEGLSTDETEELRQAFLSEARRAAPAVLSVSAMSISLSNLWLGAFVARKSGYLARPQSLAALDYPRAAALVLLAAFVFSRGDGPAGLAGAAFLGALTLAYFILGAVALLTLTAGSPLRPVAIIAIMLSLIVEPMAIVLAVFGLAENLIRFRKRRGLIQGP
jgi:hypothetical protein